MFAKQDWKCTSFLDGNEKITIKWEDTFWGTLKSVDKEENEHVFL